MYYLTPSGIDSAGGTGWTDAIRTSTKAATLMSGGDTLYMASGTYSSGIVLSDFDKGTSSSAFTQIICTTTFGARLTGTDSGQLTGNSTWYLSFTGLVFDYPAQKDFQGHYFKFTQCGFKGGAATGQNPVNTAIGTSNFQPTTDFLFEDCFWVGYTTGSARYQLLVYQSERGVIRRPVGWVGNGWTDSGSNPSAVFTVYNSSQISVQNPIVLDVIAPPQATLGQWSGAYYFVTNTGQQHGSGFNEWLGAIAFNIKGTGFYNDGNLSDSSATITDMLLVDCTSYGMALGNGTGSHTFNINRVTIILASATAATGQGYGIVKNDAGGTATIKNSIIANEPNAAVSGVSPTYLDCYNNGSCPGGTGQVTYNPRANGLTYFPRIESASNLKTAGQNGGQMGAQIQIKIGRDGTMWGDTDYNVAQSTDNVLWPFPNQSILKNELCGAYSYGLCASTYSLTQYVHAFTTAPYDESATVPTATPITHGVDVDTTTVSSERLGGYVMVGGITSSTAALAQDLIAAKAAGIGIVRFNSDCAGNLQTSSTSAFNFTQLDNVVRIVTGTAVGEYGMEIIFTMPTAPPFSVSRFVSTSTLNAYHAAVSAPTHYPTNDMAWYSTLCSTIATRYAGAIKYYESPNEGDNPDFFVDSAASLFLPNTTNYLLLLSTMATKIRAADPTAVIVGPPVAFPVGATLQILGANPQGNYVGHHWLNDLLSRGASQYIDIYDFHYYRNSEGGGIQLETCIASMTAIIQNYKSGTPRMWITEVSNTGGSYSSSDIAAEEYDKANLLYRAYSVALSTGIERIFWHTVRAYTTGGDFSLMDQDYTPRNAYNAHVALYNALNGYTYAGRANSGVVNGWKWTSGSSTRYTFGTDASTGTITISPAPCQATITNPYGQANAIGGSLLVNYSVTSNYFILDTVYCGTQATGITTLRGISVIR